MPYIEVEVVPEGTEEADVVSRTDYDAVVQERDATIEQRDTALGRITEMERTVRDTKAKYAEAVLNSGTAKQTSTKEEEKVPEPKLKMTTGQLFE